MRLSLNFLVSGHSQNDNDNADSVIEAATRKHTIYRVVQWETAIEFAFKKNEVEINTLSHKDVIDFQNESFSPEYVNMLAKVHQNDIQLTKKESKVYWLKLMRIKFTADKPECKRMLYKYHYGDDEWKFTTIYKQQQKTQCM